MFCLHGRYKVDFMEHDYDDLDDSDFEEVVDDIEESRQKVLRRMELETKSPGKKSNASYDDDFEDDFED